MPYNKLLASAIATLITFSAPAMADTPPVPTLDNLHNQGATIPDSGSVQVYPESAYTLTEIENADPDNLPENAITLYEQNDDGTVTPKYYTVSLKQTAYGDPNGTTTLTYGWEKTEEGTLEFKENPTNPVGQTITYKYDPDSFSETVSKTKDNCTVTNPTGTSLNSPYKLEGGAGLNNPADSKKSINNILYKDNKVTGTHKQYTL